MHCWFLSCLAEAQQGELRPLWQNLAGVGVRSLRGVSQTALFGLVLETSALGTLPNNILPLLGVLLHGGHETNKDKAVMDVFERQSRRTGRYTARSKRVCKTISSTHFAFSARPWQAFRGTVDL